MTPDRRHLHRITCISLTFIFWILGFVLLSSIWFTQIPDQTPPSDLAGVIRLVAALPLKVRLGLMLTGGVSLFLGLTSLAFAILGPMNRGQ